ncbi:hypothetical protein ZWY2020_057095 [Hordeum vulgare]|nr:hypothetical protein ZWY2020_057095 [Hordeum vulgare]
MAHYAGGSSSGAGGASESNWPLSLDKPLTEELHRYGLLVPSGVPPRQAVEELFNKEDVKKTSADVDVIKESVMFLRACLYGSQQG